jgi:hypothetical protein
VCVRMCRCCACAFEGLTEGSCVFEGMTEGSCVFEGMTEREQLRGNDRGVICVRGNDRGVMCVFGGMTEGSWVCSTGHGRDANTTSRPRHVVTAHGKAVAGSWRGMARPGRG